MNKTDLVCSQKQIKSVYLKKDNETTGRYVGATFGRPLPLIPASEMRYLLFLRLMIKERPSILHEWAPIPYVL